MVGGGGDQRGWIISEVGGDEDRGAVKVRDEDREAVKVVRHEDRGPRKIRQGIKVNGSHWYVPIYNICKPMLILLFQLVLQSCVSSCLDTRM